MHSKIAVSQKIDSHQDRFSGRADDSCLHPAATQRSVTINDGDGVSFLEITIHHPNSDDINIPAQPAIQSRTVILHEGDGTGLVFYPRAKADSTAGVRRDIVVRL